MAFPIKITPKTAQALKIAGIVVLGLLVLTVGVQMLTAPLGGVSQRASNSFMAPMLGGIAYNDAARDYMAVSEESAASGAPTLSIRNIGPIPPSGGVPGEDAESFEVKDYSARIETRDLDGTCATISDLKVKDYVIFEASNESDYSCNYTFKVKNDNVPEILALIDSLDPRDLSENAYTIKRQVQDFTSEIDILKAKKASIESTLATALTAYDEITELATETRDVESLAKIIDSKIRTIEQLTQQQIYVNEQLDRLERAKAEQLDRLDYTYFYVTIIENKFIDGDTIRDSWMNAAKEAIRDVNRVIQSVSVSLIALLFLAAQYMLYGVILLYIAKYAWKLAKTIWNK